MLFWPTTSHLLHTLARDPLLEKILAAQPTLPYKLHRPYLAANISSLDSLFALRDHYILAAQKLPECMYFNHFDAPVILSRIQDKNGEQVHLQLAVVDKLNKEGEVTLQICNSKGIVLANATFILMNYQQQTTLFIGGFQGADSVIPHAEIQTMTKACHGLFPKRLVFEGIRCFAQHLGIQQLVAVSNTTHIYQNWRYRYKKRYQLCADYDQFWLSLGGVQLENGHFRLPLSTPRRPIEEVSSKKRAEYRRRYQFLDNMQHGIAQHFTDHIG